MHLIYYLCYNITNNKYVQFNFILTGEAEDIEKFSRRLVKVTKQHNEECKELLKLMGIPYVNVSEN